MAISSASSRRWGGSAWRYRGKGSHGCCYPWAKTQPRRAAERDVDIVLSRSPINLANLVTVGRLLMVPPLVWLIVTERLQAAFWLFLAAGLSDALDGFIAKSFNAKTTLGSYLDPLADKVLLDGIYVALAMGQLAAGVAGRPGDRTGSADRLRRRADPWRHATFRAKPLLIGKINTFAQILLAACALGHAGGWIDLDAAVEVLVSWWRSRRCCRAPAMRRRRCARSGRSRLLEARRTARSDRAGAAVRPPDLPVLFRPILLPFLVGMAAAYLLDPAADRLQRLGLRRTSATLVITVGFFVVLVVVLVLVLPTLLTQAAELASELPGYLEEPARASAVPRLSGDASWASAELDVSAGAAEQYSDQAMTSWSPRSPGSCSRAWPCSTWCR